MQKTIEFENNSSLSHFFQDYKMNQEEIKEKAKERLFLLLETQPYKIKKVKNYRYKKEAIYEFKLVLENGDKFRIAYIFENGEILIFFISSTLIKLHFCKEVSNLCGVKKG